MEVKIKESVLSIVEGDITREETDAIVNAANSGLRGGGGVDGAIHRAGGPAIMEECRKIGSCPTGQAVITTRRQSQGPLCDSCSRSDLPGRQARRGGLLRSAYQATLNIAGSKGLKSISFPALSMGAYGYPQREAARVALQTVIDYLKGTCGAQTGPVCPFRKGCL